mmetsp:Transcript_8105/g.17536  ORF Transcript_8105/g.17536 Transcript_8105/m.17536 type:complete len:479 (+) Transcript_8105:144-1580(+)
MGKLSICLLAVLSFHISSPCHSVSAIQVPVRWQSPCRLHHHRRGIATSTIESAGTSQYLTIRGGGGQRDNNVANAATPQPERNLTPLLASTLLLMISLSVVSLSPTPILIAQYGSSRATKILATIAALAAASEIILSPILGAALDSMGRKPALTGSILSVVAVHAAVVVFRCGAIPICIGRYLSYVSLPQFFVASQAVAGDIMGSMPDKLGSFLGIQSALISAGFIGGITIAGRLSERGPEIAYGASALLALVSLAILMVGMKETLDDADKVTFDVEETKRKVMEAPVAAGHLLVGRGAKVGALALLLVLQSMPMFMGDVIQVYAREQWGLGQNGIANLISIFGLTGIVSSLVGSVLIKRIGLQNFTGLAILSALLFPLAAMVSYKASLIAVIVGFLGSAQTIGVVAELTAQVSAMGARQGEMSGERASLLALTKVICPLVYGGLYVLGSRIGTPQLIFAFNAVLALLSFILSRRDLW